MPRRNNLSQKQLDFIQWFTSPASPTYDNVRQSAMKAGYSETYATGLAYRNLVPLAAKYKPSLNPQKQLEKTEKAANFYEELLRDAERGIAQRVRMHTNDDPKLIQIQQKDQHFVSERLGKDKWSARKEVENVGFTENVSDMLSNFADMLTKPQQTEPLPVQYEQISDDDEPKRVEKE